MIDSPTIIRSILFLRKDVLREGAKVLKKGLRSSASLGVDEYHKELGKVLANRAENDVRWMMKKRTLKW